MLTDKCNAIIDEAITAGGDLTKLSAEAAAHIETCLECRKSLESINALKASAVSVIPLVAADAALKTKIASGLEGAMAARRAASSVAATKTLLGVSSVLLGVGLLGAIACGIMVFDNRSGMALKPIQDNSNKSSIEQVVASSSVDTNVSTYTTDVAVTTVTTVTTATETATVTNKTEAEGLETDKSELEDCKDMRDPNASESEEIISQTLPSVIEDSGD